MIINPVISASGGLTASIIVTAPTGSAVTCTTPGGIVLTAIEISGTWTFADLPGPGIYSVAAVLGAQSKTVSVVVDRIAEYQVSIYYRLYLYNEGDECTDVTGGWERNYNYYQATENRGGSVQKDSDSIRLINGMNYNTSVVIATNNLIDISGHNKLYVKTSIDSSDTYFYQGRVHLTTQQSGNIIATDLTIEAFEATTVGKIIPSFASKNFRCLIGVNGMENDIPRGIRISKIWLE